MKIKIYQDGREFYNDVTGDLVFQSSILVSNYDLESAQKARREFLDYCERKGIEVEWN